MLYAPSCSSIHAPTFFPSVTDLSYMKKLIAILLMIIPLVDLAAAKGSHELRFTMGDMLYETLIYHDDLHFDYSGAGSPNALFVENHGYAWSPHLGLEYQYRCLDWLGIGLHLDWQNTGWNRIYYDHLGREVTRTRERFYNMCIIPNFRFTYVQRDRFNLYSSVGAGLVINGGTELDMAGNRTAYGVAFQAAVLGMAFGQDPWWGFIEVGGLSGLKDTNTIYLLASRILTLGIGLRL